MDVEKNTAPRKYYDAPLWRKSIVTFTTSWVTLAACFSSTSLFSAAVQIAEDLNTTPALVNVSSALVLFTMGCSTLLWGPIASICGRNIAYNACIVVLLLFSIGAALSPNWPSFLLLRLLSGFQGSFFHVTGQAILADYFPPVQRGLATAFFLSGTVLGPPLGPLVAGIIVTYSSWRVILWVQCGMIGLGLLLSIAFLWESKAESARHWTFGEVLREFNPLKIVKMLRYPRVLMSDFACGLLSFSQYALLAAPVHILRTKYNLTSPLVAGLFFLSPGAGFLVGTILGGRWSDITVRRWIVKRDGVRLPQDRLRSGFISFFGIVPVASLVYGWAIDRQVGGLALPIVAAFFSAVGALSAFAPLNTFCSEVMPEHRREVIATKYLIQYAFSAAASASCVPLIDTIGAGAQSTIAAGLVVIGGILTLSTAFYGGKDPAL